MFILFSPLFLQEDDASDLLDVLAKLPITLDVLTVGEIGHCFLLISLSEDADRTENQRFP